MRDLVVAIGLVLVIEGLLWAVFPRMAFRLLEAASELPEQSLRVAGALSIAFGVFLVWLIRG
ncbi:MAG: DUF2065 domain-containing protein [Hyphomicrobiaceae bacterium]|nr:DUF2065 domain-containing protein [Hyphomicrobiaceae bacterium]